MLPCASGPVPLGGNTARVLASKGDIYQQRRLEKLPQSPLFSPTLLPLPLHIQPGYLQPVIYHLLWNGSCLFPNVFDLLTPALEALCMLLLSAKVYNSSSLWNSTPSPFFHKTFPAKPGSNPNCLCAMIYSHRHITIFIDRIECAYMHRERRLTENHVHSSRHLVGKWTFNTQDVPVTTFCITEEVMGLGNNSLSWQAFN